MHLLMFNTENFRHVKPGFMQPSVGACPEGRTEHITWKREKEKLTSIGMTLLFF